MALVLSRKKGQVVCIGVGIEVVVVEVYKGTVKLGFTCPHTIPIRRKELTANAAPDHYVHDWNVAGEIAANVQIALAQGHWPAAHAAVESAKTRFESASHNSFSDLVGQRAASSLARVNIHSIEELGRADPMRLLLAGGIGEATIADLGKILERETGRGWLWDLEANR